jgi:hypothetical protein
LVTLSGGFAATVSPAGSVRPGLTIHWIVIQYRPIR